MGSANPARKTRVLIYATALALMFLANPVQAEDSDLRVTVAACVATALLGCSFDCGSNSDVVIQVVAGGTGSAACGGAKATCSGLQCTDSDGATRADVGYCSVTQGFAVCSAAG